MNYENLHTSTLEKLFGTVNLKILKQHEELRIIELNDNQGITRTLGVARFFNIHGNVLTTAHNKIVAGSLMGKTLYEANINFEKEFLGFINAPLPHWLKTDFRSKFENGLAFYSKIFVSDDSLGDKRFLYAELLEIIPKELEDAFVKRIIPANSNQNEALSLMLHANLETIKI